MTQEKRNELPNKVHSNWKPIGNLNKFKITIHSISEIFNRMEFYIPLNLLHTCLTSDN